MANHESTPLPAGMRGRLGVRSAIALALLAAGGAGVWYATRPAPVAVLVDEARAGRVETTVANTRAGSVAVRVPSAGSCAPATRCELLRLRRYTWNSA